MDEFYEKLEALLREHKQIFGDSKFITPEVLLEAVGDTLEELAEVSKDHARVECLDSAIQESHKIIIKEREQGGVILFVEGVRNRNRNYEGQSISEALDNMHKGEHTE